MIFGVGENTAFQKLVKGNPTLQSCANTFLQPNQNTDVIENLGCQAMAFLFGGEFTDNLALMRYNMFSKKVISATSFVTPELLPPTQSAIKLHSRRTYYQMMVWIGRDGGTDAINWGWKLEEDQLVPVMSKMNAAPESYPLQLLYFLQNTTL